MSPTHVMPPFLQIILASITIHVLVANGQMLPNPVPGPNPPPGVMCPDADIELNSCLRLADPFIQDSKFVFPVSASEIQEVCGLWTRFTDCVRSYVLRCLHDRMEKFDRAVQDAEDSMRQLCHDPQYQSEYLLNANCIKAVCVGQQRCGTRYQKLVAEVSAQPAMHESLCCHFAKFRSCVQTMTRINCSESASRFAIHMIDKAMGYILRSCNSHLQTDSIDECPSSGHDVLSSNSVPVPSNGINTNFNQAVSGSQLPTWSPPGLTYNALPPNNLSPDNQRPTPRWSYDPQSVNGILPESLQGNGQAAVVGSKYLSIMLLLITIIFKSFV